jgi:hypothetical protein
MSYLHNGVYGRVGVLKPVIREPWLGRHCLLWFRMLGSRKFKAELTLVDMEIKLVWFHIQSN